MKTLYLDCAMGAAGDMLTAALLELMPDKAGAIAELNAIGIPNVVYGYETVTRCGIRGTHMSVKVNGVETDVDTLTPEQKRRLATMINVTLLNVRFAGQAHFYPVEEPKEQSLSQPCG